jgi:hypothetical protein
MENNTYFYRDFVNENANISTRNRTEMYALAYSFRQEKLLILINFILTSLSALTLFILLKIYKCDEMRRIFSIVDPGLKIILFLGYFAHIVGAFNSTLFFGYKFSILLFDFGPLFYIWYGNSCFWTQFTFVSTRSFINFSVFFATFIERVYVSIGFKSNCKFGCFLVFLILTLTLNGQIKLCDPKNYENERVYCDNLITMIDSNVILSLYILVMIDLTISLMDFCLLLFNKRRIRAYKWVLNCFRFIFL